MPTVLRTRLDVILLAVRQRLINELGWPPERVIVAKRDVLPFNAQADQYCIIQPRSQVTEQPIVQGAGRVDTRVTRRVAVIVRTRLSLDESDRDLAWLTDATYGHLRTEHAVLNALQMYQPTRGADWLACEPLRLVPVSQPEQDREQPEWGQSVAEFEVTYVLDLDQSYQ